MDQEGMDYLVTRYKRFVTIYLPIALFMFLLLFPFYWMGLTSIKENKELLDLSGNPWWFKSAACNSFLNHFTACIYGRLDLEYLERRASTFV